MARLELIDDVKWLSLGHHFVEIMHARTSIIAKNGGIFVVVEEDLHVMALSFRLHRQHGFHVSQNVYTLKTSSIRRLFS